MFSAMYSGFELKDDNRKVKRASLETIEVTRRNIEMFLLQIYHPVDEHQICTADQSASTLEYFFKLLTVSNKHLQEHVDDDFNGVIDVFRRYTVKTTNVNDDKSKRSLIFVNKKYADRMNSLNCLFTWDLHSSTSNKDIIAHIKRKYGDYNLDITRPVFTFERYISNIIIAYELFHKGNREMARIVMLLIDKWLDELDRAGYDEFYLSISYGLKSVLASTFVHMESKNKNSFKNTQKLLDIIQSFCDLEYKSKATVYAIQAAVLIEYGRNENYFKKAIECVKMACDLNQTNSYWPYLHSLVLRAQRHFLNTYKSCPTINEKNAIEAAIALSDQNVYIKYHKIILIKDEFLHNYHKNKNNFDSDKHLFYEEKIVLMIKDLVVMELKDPLLAVNCAKMLMTLPTIAHDFDLGWKLLTKGLQMAPNDLIVLKAVARVIFLSKRNIKDSVVIAHRSSQEESPRTSTRAQLIEHLTLAVKKHNAGEDPVPYLKRILVTNYNYDMTAKWKIMVQICSYTILYGNDLESGIEYFMMLSEAEQNGFFDSNLILCHYSSFLGKYKKFNLAELIYTETETALNNNILVDKKHYYNILAKIMLIYQIEVENINSSLRLNLTEKPKDKNNRLQQHEFKNNVLSKTHSNNQNSDVSSRPKNRRRSRSRRSGNRQNNDNENNVDVDDNVVDSDSNDSNNNNNCCTIL